MRPVATYENSPSDNSALTHCLWIAGDEVLTSPRITVKLLVAVNPTDEGR